MLLTDDKNQQMSIHFDQDTKQRDNNNNTKRKLHKKELYVLNNAGHNWFSIGS